MSLIKLYLTEETAFTTLSEAVNVINPKFYRKALSGNFK
jgi:hypothetical protein